MISIVVLSLALFAIVVPAYSFVRSGRWTTSAYRNWVIGAVVIYSVLVALILTRFGHA